jgi:hypothetical protein
MGEQTPTQFKRWSLTNIAQLAITICDIMSLVQNNLFLTKMFSTTCCLQLGFLYIGDSHLSQPIYIIGK